MMMEGQAKEATEYASGMTLNYHHKIELAATSESFAEGNVVKKKGKESSRNSRPLHEWTLVPQKD